jgi:hypothetical protein
MLQGCFVLETILSFPCRHRGLLSQSNRYRPRSPRPPTTGRRAETETATAKIELLGPTLLCGTPPVLAPLDGRPGPRETRYRDRLAPHRLPVLLALAISATRRTTEDHRGDSRSDPTLGARESGLGEPRRSTASSRNSASSFRSGVWRGICDACGVAATLPSAG